MSIEIQIPSSNITISGIVFANNNSCNAVIDGSSNVSFSSFRSNILDNTNKQFVQKKNVDDHLEGHTGSLVNNKIYIIGGHNGSNTYSNLVLVYDIPNNSWVVDSPNGVEKMNHSAVYYELTKRIYLFGGVTSNLLGLNFFKNDTMYYDIELKTFTTISLSTKPSARDGHAYTLGGDLLNKMYIIGGRGGSSTYYNDTWYFDILSENWIEVATSGTSPSARSLSTCIYYRGDGGGGSEKKIYLFGGHNGSTYHNDVHILDLSTDENGSWSNVTISGSPPHVMSGHTMNYLPGSDCFLVFGGFSGSSSYYNDIWKFNMRTNTWIKDLVSGPSGIHLHTSVLYNDTTTNRYQLFVFGGSTQAGLQDKIWRCDFGNVLTDPLKISDLSGQRFY